MDHLRLTLYILGALGYFYAAYQSHKQDVGWQVTLSCTLLGSLLAFASVVLIFC